MRTRKYRYEVIGVWGSMEGRLHPGTVVIDIWKGDGIQQWDVMHMPTGEIIGGWTGEYIGEHTAFDDEGKPLPMSTS